MNKYIQAIITAHELKDKPLDVKYFQDYVFWDEENDTGYQEYKNARNIIGKSKVIEKLLARLKII